MMRNAIRRQKSTNVQKRMKTLTDTVNNEIGILIEVDTMITMRTIERVIVGAMSNLEVGITIGLITKEILFMKIEEKQMVVINMVIETEIVVPIIAIEEMINPDTKDLSK